MRRLGYRTPRFQVNFPVYLAIGNDVKAARCTDISLDGMRLELDERLARDAMACVSFEVDGERYVLQGRVARSQLSGAGLRFVFASKGQQNKVHELIGRVTTIGQAADHSLVHMPLRLS